jgi:hypothetical protein
MSSKVPAWKVMYETGPCANDCYSLTVYANTKEAAQRAVENKYPKTAYVTDVTMIKGTTMSQYTVNAQTARMATDKARSLDGEYKRVETTKILESVQGAAAKGQDSVQAGSLDEVVKLRLQNLGFNVQWVDGQGQRDDSYFTISW